LQSAQRVSSADFCAARELCATGGLCVKGADFDLAVIGDSV